MHSAVEFTNGSIMAQLASPDMRIPIQYAIDPERKGNNFKKFSFFDYPRLNFERPDPKRFICFNVGQEAVMYGGTAPAVLNGADEAAIELLMKGRIKFTDIPILIEHALKDHVVIPNPSIEQVLLADRYARKNVFESVERNNPSKLLRKPERSGSRTRSA